MHQITPCLLHPSSKMPAFVKGDPPSPPLVVLAVIDVGDCGYICSMCHMICMPRMAAKFSQQHIVVRRISWYHRLYTPVGMCNRIHLVLSRRWGIAVLLFVFYFVNCFVSGILLFLFWEKSYEQFFLTQPNHYKLIPLIGNAENCQELDYLPLNFSVSACGECELVSRAESNML